MAILSNDQATGFKDCIANDIPSRAFRYATESKNVLSTAGAMYVGTGIKRKTIMLLEAPVWVSGSNYSAGDIVIFNGRNYEAKSDITGSTTNPSSATSVWDDISIVYDSYVTAVLEAPPYSTAIFQIRYITLQYKNNTVVYKDANGYLADSGTAVSGYFPCWCTSGGIPLSSPRVIG